MPNAYPLMSEAVEVGGDALLSEANAVVASGFGKARPTRNLGRFRAQLLELVSDLDSGLTTLVVSQTRRLVERMEEAETEWQLARILGPSDTKAEEALARAVQAVSKDGPALFRSVQLCLRAEL